eukprot:scaffold143342_cov175-Phaeocystis_antarctica.AAC.1
MNRPKRFVCAGPGVDCAAPGPSSASSAAPEKKTSGGKRDPRLGQCSRAAEAATARSVVAGGAPGW